METRLLTVSLALITSVVAYLNHTELTSTLWRTELEQDIILYVNKLSTSSALKCVCECTRKPMCNSCGYDKNSGLCYLEVTTALSTISGPKQDNVTLYTKVCQEEQAPINFITTNVEWRNTISGLEGIQTCKDDYLFSGTSTILQCSVTGQWSFNGDCRQRIWSNAQTKVKYPVPRTPGPRWAVCIHGVPTQNHRFYINLFGGTVAILHVDFRMHVPGLRPGNTTILLDSRLNLEWNNNKHILHPTQFPVVQDQPYRIKIYAVNLTFVQLYVDDVLITNHTLPDTIGIHEVTDVYMYGSTNVTWLDLWCEQ